MPQANIRPRARRAAAQVFALGAISMLPGTWGARTGSTDAHAQGLAATRSSTTQSSRHSYGISGDRSQQGAFEYAILESSSRVTLSVSGSERRGVIGRLQDEVKRGGRRILWFSIDHREYVVRDQALVAQASGIVEPVQTLGEEQGRLGAIQGRLGARQGELGRIQGQIARIQARLSLPLSGLDPHERAERESLRRQVRELAERARELAAQQQQLGVRQQEIGRRQAELGHQQARASERATAELRGLAEDAISSGKAVAIED